MRQWSVRGCRLTFVLLFVYFVIKTLLIFSQFPPPSLNLNIVTHKMLRAKTKISYIHINVISGMNEFEFNSLLTFTEDCVGF